MHPGQPTRISPEGHAGQLFCSRFPGLGHMPRKGRMEASPHWEGLGGRALRGVQRCMSTGQGLTQCHWAC